MTRAPVIEASGVSFAWPTGAALTDVNLAVAEGEMVAVVGPNGAGKSTLLRVLSVYLKPSAGRVLLRGRDVGSYGRRAVARLIALVPQYTEVNLPYTVSALASLGRYPHLGAFGAPGDADRRAVARAMARADVTGLADRPLNQLSGGEFQRAILARALAQEPAVILLDEPTAHLDLSHQGRLVTLLRELNRLEGMTVVAALHDLNLAARFPRVVLLAGGRVQGDGDAAGVFEPALLSRAYGCDVRVTVAEGERFVYPRIN